MGDRSNGVPQGSAVQVLVAVAVKVHDDDHDHVQ
jgi:hypothetical protein